MQPLSDIAKSEASSRSVASGAKMGWAKYFGYDIFISFALGPAPRGCRAYASDLARRLRERGFTVFYSEDEAPVGSELDITLRRALRRSRILVVIANRGTLADPRWVRVEVEEYLGTRRQAVVVPINVDGALQDPTLIDATQKWLPFSGRIWVDEDQLACESGRVSDAVIERLVTAPHAVRSLVRLRGVVGLVLAGFALLATFALIQRHTAIDQRNRAQQELLSSSTQQALLLSRDGRAHEGWDVLVNALAQAQPNVDGVLPEGFLEAALTSLVENRRGPTLDFDINANAPRAREEGDSTPPPFAFDAQGSRVAVAAGAQLAVWATADGHRLTQVALPIHVEQLTFAAQGTVLIAEGPELSHQENPERRVVQRAVAVDIASGRLKTLPLTLCEKWIPCISDGTTSTRLFPLAELPASALTDWPRGKSFVAAAAGPMRVHGRSGQQFVLLTRAQSSEQEPEWLLLDRQSGIASPLKVPLRHIDNSVATDYGVASAAPLLVASSNVDPTIVVHRIETGAAGPRLVELRRILARQAGATQGVRLNAKGTTLMYQNFRYGTGVGVGIGRTVVFDIASGREVWARSEGEVVWGSTLVALEEDWVETHLMSAETGSTWFVVPGRPVGFDPTGRMLLMWDMLESKGKASSWPSVRLLETLPVRQFARQTRGPASVRGACALATDWTFSTLGERFDRIWNRDDWHRELVATTSSGIHETASVIARPFPEVEPQDARAQLVSLQANGSSWRLYDEAGKTEDLTRTEVERRYPLLGSELRSGKDVEAFLSSSADGRWSAVVTLVDDEQEGDRSCKGWARWRVHRGNDPIPVKSGCTTGESAGSGQIPRVSFLPTDVKAGGQMLIAVPSDTCRYELVDPERGAPHGAVVPAFGNAVMFERIAHDLLIVRSTDWYEETLAYQLHSLAWPSPGPLFMITNRNLGEEGEAAKVRQGIGADDAHRLYVLADESDEVAGQIKVAVALGGDVLNIAEHSITTAIKVPPWGARLLERLRQAVLLRRH